MKEGYDGSISARGVNENVFVKLETPNIVVSFGEGIAKFSVNFIENYTLLRRFKWWLFCKVFPFRVEKFEKRKELK